MSDSRLHGPRDSPMLTSTHRDRCSVPLPVLPRQELADAVVNTSARPRPSSAAGEGALLDDMQLVAGYLAAVAMRLDQRGLIVRETHPTASRDTLAGHITLAPCRADPVHWAPAQLDWSEHHGWSATLRPTPTSTDPAKAGTTGTGLSGHTTSGHAVASHAVTRYLPHQIVPAPVTVAHFAAALNTHDDTVWATAIYRQQRCMDRRLLILRLSQFGLPEPW